MGSNKVFISYSHDRPEHSARVLALANALRANGVDAELDQYHERPPRGWPQWCEEQLRPDVSRYVLIVCTAKYLARVQDQVPADEGRGVNWEGKIVHNYLYDEKENLRFVPLLLDDEPESSLPIVIKHDTRYRIKAFDLGDAGFEALYRELTRQQKTPKAALGPVANLATGAAPAPLPSLPTQSAFAPPTLPPVDILHISAYAPNDLIGREDETAVIEDAWARAMRRERHPHVLAFVALGGGGKTSLVAHWANDMNARDWPGAQIAFAWSFYRQSSSEQAGASSDLFFAEALKFFGLKTIEGESGHEKGRRLASHIGETRALLILDGLEPLQYAPSPAHNGELKDDALRALLRGLAQRNAGLCLITTRYRAEDLKGPTVSQRDLAPLSDEAGGKLLASLGVNGAEAGRRRFSADVKGHALTLEIVGSYLRRAHGGEIARRDRINLGAASAAKGGHAMRAMAAYEAWFESAGEEGARALALLRLTGLFDRAIDAGCLAALCETPPIEGLTEPLVDLSEEERNLALSTLEEAKLLTVKWADGSPVEVDAHPLLREYFAGELRKKRPEAWREAHRRLYAHLTATEDKEKPTLDDLQPLYQAVAHGCAAGLWQETCEKVYYERICRRSEDYPVKKLGAFGADLGAVACFFEAPWRRVSPHLTPVYQAWMMNLAGFRLRALGRLGEAREPMRVGLDMRVAQEDWKNAATAAANLSELELTLGRIETAVGLGATAVAHADRSGDASQRLARRTDEADARHQAGDRAAVDALFATAETMQAEWRPHEPLLYSLQGYQYCDLKLGAAERAAWRRLTGLPAVALGEPGVGDADGVVSIFADVTNRAGKALKIAEGGLSLLSVGLDHLTLARAALYAAVLRAAPSLRDHLDNAVGFIRRAGAQHHLPRPLLIRALHRAINGDFAGAGEDLDEAYETAERGPMKLHQADIHLHRARLFGLLADRPTKYPWVSAKHDLAGARKLIEECGYKRRLPELEDAETALAALGG